jgi:hypothetical protein
VKAIANGVSFAFYRIEDLLHAMKRTAALPRSCLGGKKHFNSALLVVDEVAFQPMCPRRQPSSSASSATATSAGRR